MHLTRVENSDTKRVSLFWLTLYTSYNDVFSQIVSFDFFLPVMRRTFITDFVLNAPVFDLMTHEFTIPFQIPALYFL